MVLAAGEPRAIGAASQSRLHFGEGPKETAGWAGRRLLWLDESPAFELSFWCGTCPFLFERLEGANSTCSIEDLEHRLADGISGLDEDVIARFGSLLPSGQYLPLLLQVQPHLVRPAQPGDYFAEEQVATWGPNAFWGLPEYPRTPYYRTYETPVDADAHLYDSWYPWSHRPGTTETASATTPSNCPAPPSPLPLPSRLWISAHPPSTTAPTTTRIGG